MTGNIVNPHDKWQRSDSASLTGMVLSRMRIRSSRNTGNLWHLTRKFFREFSMIIENGMKDGSIRSDLDPLKGAHAIAFITTGFINEISIAGRSFAMSHNMDIDEFVNYSYSILMDSLKAK